ncbi:MAG TPA: hypothetical protein VNX25_04790 [Verrucomicrobiae bacterium]|nr:hypothetical protein [Verrucomicrobiae bacterium]
MSEPKLVHEKQFDFLGQSYSIRVFAAEGGRVFAETAFDHDDIIVSDGTSVEEVIQLHEKLIPLAIDSRKILRTIPVAPYTTRTYRSR